MHTFYKEHSGSYGVGVPWHTSSADGMNTDWHTLFSGLSLERAMFVVHHLNGGDSPLDPKLLKILEACST